MTMIPPVLVAAPATAPVTRVEAKAHLRIDAAETVEDALVDLLIAAATQRLDGYRGDLGTAMVTQTWRQDFAAWADPLRLATGPVQAISHIKYDNDAGGVTTLADTVWRHRRDAAGDYVTLKADQDWPDDLADDGLIQVTFTAGFGAAADVPAPLKAAILLIVGHLYANREEVVTGVPVATLPRGVPALIKPYLQPRFH